MIIRQLSKMTKTMRFIDIGANITDDMYKGLYNGSQKHEADLTSVLKRCWDGGMEKMIITAGNLSDTEAALKLTELDERLYTTVGCHPTRCNEFEKNPDEYISKLKEFVKMGGSKIVALGECGLDYDRLKFCDMETQKKFFDVQLQLCEDLKLPLFLHCRAAWDDFFQIVSQHETQYRGVVHSFDGSEENMHRVIDMGFYIGINGCSLKTEANLEVAAKIPVEKLLIETDCPWCEIRPTHAGAKFIKTKFLSVKKEKFTTDSMIKGRNEPVNIVQVIEVLAAVRNEDPTQLSETILDNTNKLFFANV